MTNSGRNKDPYDGRPVQVQLIHVGSPEHAESIARELGLPPQPPPGSPPPSQPQPRPQTQAELHTTEELIHTSVRPEESALSPERHERKCIVCHHPRREEIEEMFLQWHQPYSLAYSFDIRARALYRHAHATGLYAARQKNIRFVLDRFLERVQEATVTGDAIIRAVRAYSCLTPDNKWVEPPTRVTYSSERRGLPSRRPKKRARK